MEIVLVHGGLHGAWCWEHVVSLLREEGYTASAPDLPGMGQDRTPLPEVTLASTADFLAGYVGSRQEVVLVGHSMAGPVISECAERVPEHLLGLVYLAANLVPSGQSIREAAGVDLDGVMTGVHISADGLSSTYEPETALTVFYNSTDRAEAEPCHRPANAAAPRTNQRAFIANQGTLRLGPPRLYRMSSGPRDPHRLSTQDAASTAVHACRGDGLRSLALLVPARGSFPTHHRYCELFSKQAGTARLRLISNGVVSNQAVRRSDMA